MALFQKSVLNKYLKERKSETVTKHYKKFVKYFHNPTIQQNIRESKEEQFQEGFLRELFMGVLGYTLNPHANYNLTTELKNEKGAKKADGAILKDGNALGVIELKSTKTKDLEQVRQQAFDYKANQRGCVYVITSNFEKIRFYINNAVDFEEFDLFNIEQERFELLYLCLAKDNILSNVPLKIKEASVQEEEHITKKLYADYSLFKRELFCDLVKLNMKNKVFQVELNIDSGAKNIKRILFKESQKMIDRFLFIFFAEDKGLLPPNSTLKILEQWDKLKDLDAYVPLYDRYKLYFNYLDTGRKGTNKSAEIFAYNGGLFKPDTVLDSLLISDELLYKHTASLSRYDFESQVDVNILGHIFENSLNEIESVNAEIEETDFDKQKTKRKKEGIFYTPKYITKYIVDNTVGKLCNEKKDELKIVEQEFRPRRQKETKKKLLNSLKTYREWLLELTILDPACGSGAFLNQALDFLIKEHGYIDELQTKLLGGGFVFPNVENTVLENNIFGVDLNEESVEIAKLSLWLRTAQPRRKLNDLSNNIKCGNSLIDSKTVAGDKAFKWENEFTQVFEEQDKQAFHITTATHDSRTSQRMIDYKVRALRDNGTRPKAEPVWLEPQDELLICKTIAEIVEEDKLNVMAFNVCGDHMHLLLVCEEYKVSSIMQKIKAKTSKVVNISKGITTTMEHAPLSKHAPLSNTRGEKQNALWTQKYGCKKIESEKQLWNTVEYIRNNREKHHLDSSNKGINPLVKIINEMCCSYDHAFRTETTGGFDVVIGNPPYVIVFDPEVKNFLEEKYPVFKRNNDLYTAFYQKAIKILKEKGALGFITPNSFVKGDYFKNLRQYLIKYQINLIVDFTNTLVFEDANVFSAIIILSKESGTKDWLLYKDLDKIKGKIENGSSSFILENSIQKKLNEIDLFDKHFLIKDVGFNYWSVGRGKVRGDSIGSRILYNGDILNHNDIPYIKGSNFNRYTGISVENYLRHDYKSYLNENDVFRYSPNILETSPKLIYRQTSSKLIGTLDYEKYYCDKTIHVIINREGGNLDMSYVLGIFNSRLLNYMYSLLTEESGRSFAQVKTVNIKKLPFKIASFDCQKSIVKLVDIVLKSGLKFSELVNKLERYLQSQLSLEKLPNKLQNWYELEFGDFIKELNKVIKKRNTEVATATTMGHVPLAKLSKMDEMEWMEVFETKKAEVQTLKTEIDKTDKEINTMVYELYGLNEEEIRIVENN